MNRSRAIIFAIFASLAIFFASSSPAFAAAVWPSHSSYTNSYYTSYSNVRTCASTACAVSAVLYNTSTVWMECYADGGWATGNYSSNRWFWVWYGSGGGWVHSSLVFNQASVPRASSIYGC